MQESRHLELLQDEQEEEEHWCPSTMHVSTQRGRNGLARTLLVGQILAPAGAQGEQEPQGMSPGFWHCWGKEGVEIFIPPGMMHCCLYW